MCIAQAWQSLFQMPQLAVVMGCLIPIIAIIGGIWHSAIKTRSENSLKRSMVERGMSVEEIERVLAAGGD